MGLGVQFSEMVILADFQTEFLEIFMQQKYEIIIFSSNNLLETHKIYWYRYKKCILSLKTIEWKNNSVIMIDQTKLPNSLEFVTYTDYNQIADAIKTLVVRGAPAIGVSGAFGLALAA